MQDELGIQARHRLIEALAAAEDAARARLDQLREIVFETDAQGRIVFLNAAWERILKHRRDVCLGRALTEFVVDNDRSLWHALSSHPSPATGHAEIRVSNASGTALVFEAVASRLGSGGVVGSLHDVSARKQAEAERREARMRYRAILDNSSHFIGLLDLDGCLVDVNRTALRFAGVEATQVLGIPFRDTPWWDHSIDEQAKLDEAIEQARAGSAVRFETTHPAADGAIRHIEFSLTPIADTDGRIAYLLPEGRDITERKRAEQRFRLVVESSANALLLVDAKGVIQLANAQAESWFGYSREELVGHAVDMLVPTMQRAQHARNREAYLARPAVRPMNAGGRELFAQRKDGSTFPVEIGLNPIETDAGPMVLSSIVDVSERWRTQEALHRAKEAAEKASVAKSEFLANMSHEIRTPLNGILSATELLAAGEILPSQREYLDIIQTSGEALLAVVNDVLDFSKVEAGKLELEHVAFSPREQALAVLRLFSVEIATKPLQVRCDLEPDLPDQLVGDPVRLRQILMNLIGNAIKFTEQGEIVLRVSLESSADDSVKLRFTVSDTGIGIPSDRLATLFSPFVQVDSSTTRRFGGTGLGLAISRRLVTLMQGESGVVSDLGHGSTFWFTATFGRNRAAAAATLLGDRQKPDGDGALPSARVLLVEDNPVNRTMLLALLGRLGHRVDAVINGRECLEALAQRRYDVILMDCQMPELDGYQTTQIIRDPGSRVLDHAVPVIALTAHALPGDRERCLASGMDDYLTKPVRGEQLRLALSRWLGLGECGGGDYAEPR
ncbi:PAS domain S-box protein [Methylolobus aquaticus]